MLKNFQVSKKVSILATDKDNNNIKIKMKTNRNYRFVLTVLDNAQLETGECRIANDEVSGKRMFASECHYYAEKNIIECIKDAAKSDTLGKYYNHTYCIYKEDKPKKVVTEREEDGKKITEEHFIGGAAMLIEVITVDENGINIR